MRVKYETFLEGPLGFPIWFSILLHFKCNLFSKDPSSFPLVIRVSRLDYLNPYWHSRPQQWCYSKFKDWTSLLQFGRNWCLGFPKDVSLSVTRGLLVSKMSQAFCQKISQVCSLAGAPTLQLPLRHRGVLQDHLQEQVLNWACWRQT